MIKVVYGSKNSGKIPYAEDLCSKIPGNKYYLATMRVKTDDDKKKVERHRKEREEKGFVTIEQDVAIVKAIDKIKWMDSLLGNVEGDRVAMIASLPNLCANEMFLPTGEIVPHKEVESTILCGLALLQEFFASIVIVSDDDPELSYYGDIDVEQAVGIGEIDGNGIKEYKEAMKELNAALKTLADEEFRGPFKTS
ncbi:MAG: bifunctional adenosylcobinamide kinase/adenosylcobinamide-phosphate guanylyltransferase [Lachnospiraceae bacterium]|nr:bifunctional adenosylcobinamide kinase/adenosylcobinamide-phosphate guanylyltransferase [Lachnospiraceae bacterium]